MNVIERAMQRWNSLADEFNQWSELDIDEKLNAIKEQLKIESPDLAVSFSSKIPEIKDEIIKKDVWIGHPEGDEIILKKVEQ